MDAIAIDLESNAKDPRCDNGFQVLGVSYATTDGEDGYLPIGHFGISIDTVRLGLSKLSSLLARGTILVFHNAKYDLISLERIGINLWARDWYDTMLMQHMVDENLPNKSLDYLGKLHFNEGKEKDDVFNGIVKNLGWAFLPVSIIEPYAIQDARLTLKLFEKLYPLCLKEGYLS